MIQHRSIRRARALALGLLAAAALALAPAGVRAEEESKCTDAAWADYNTCLVNSGNFEWAKRECDLEFQSQYSECYKWVLKGIAFLISAI